MTGKLVALISNSFYVVGVTVLKFTDYINADTFIICLIILAVNGIWIGLRGDK